MSRSLGLCSAPININPFNQEGRESSLSRLRALCNPFAVRNAIRQRFYSIQLVPNGPGTEKKLHFLFLAMPRVLSLRACSLMKPPAVVSSSAQFSRDALERLQDSAMPCTSPAPHSLYTALPTLSPRTLTPTHRRLPGCTGHHRPRKKRRQGHTGTRATCAQSRSRYPCTACNARFLQRGTAQGYDRGAALECKQQQRSCRPVRVSLIYNPSTRNIALNLRTLLHLQPHLCRISECCQPALVGPPARG